MTYLCVRCLESYDPLKSRAELKGFCSMRCQHTFEKSLGLKFKHGKLITGSYKLRNETLHKLRTSITGAEPVTHIS